VRRDSTPHERQFKPVDVPCNKDLVEIWIEMVAAPPPPDGHHTLSLASGPGIYRRLCGGILLTGGISVSPWTSLAVKIWSSYGLTCGGSRSARVAEEVGEVADGVLEDELAHACERVWRFLSFGLL
jgi:hypothetical protein